MEKDMLDPAKRRKRGLETYKKMGWGENEAIRAVDEDLWQLTTDVLFGEIWCRPGLSLRERELITLTILMGDMTEGIKVHMSRAHHLGIAWHGSRVRSWTQMGSRKWRKA